MAWARPRCGRKSRGFGDRSESKEGPLIRGNGLCRGRKQDVVTKSQRPGLTALIAFAHALADLSGVAILPYFRRPIPVKNKAGKGGFDPVTVADRSAERAISRALAQHWPEHGLEGEEFGCRHAPGRPVQSLGSSSRVRAQRAARSGLMNSDHAAAELLQRPVGPTPGSAAWVRRAGSRWPCPKVIGISWRCAAAWGRSFLSQASRWTSRGHCTAQPPCGAEQIQMG